MKNSIASDPVIKTQGDYGWDAVLEYRVWGQPEPDPMEPEIGSDYYFAFVTDAEADEALPVPPKKAAIPGDPAK